MDQSNRVTKDVSARKTPTKMHSAMEMQAVRASHEAYLNSMIRGYEEQAATAAAEHEQEIKDLKAAMTTDKAQITRDKEATVSEAVRRALAGSTAQVDQLQAEVQRLQKELQESQKDYANLRESANERIRNKNVTITNMKVQHDNEVADLKEQLKEGPNSWLEIHLKCKGRRDRTYVRRPYTTFSDAVEELFRTTGEGRSNLRFRVKGEVVQDSDLSKTMQEVSLSF